MKSAAAVLARDLQEQRAERTLKPLSARDAMTGITGDRVDIPDLPATLV